ncbi:MAG: hypothetical protein COX80_01550 [Candidatus Magasanikbacteria bacterium CG_4_10_14_0_2_um_filter_33_14]|uniref:SCP domain-containing protein n=1 Tax=Candidatus Magasanikbacteria bacterium CG_4_10_14_0_2_um_filter_33_14 TaxID=1974636 RepID=A0A2M7VBE5_9BACT|nr:MAG: hypothetical protein COX80_01550 [Candidatus Magasanikbacteria bacterium CG_4_10_14_0_2_um_filter_33_14]
MYIRRVLKNYFIPHVKNGYHPHILHTKRTIFYSLFFLLTKMMVVLFVVLLPLETFSLPEVKNSIADKIIAETNKVRNKLAVRSLDTNEKLFSSANAKSWDMVRNDYFDHISPDGKRLRDFLQEADYDYRMAGENLAVGYKNSEDLMVAWENSPSHYDNLIDKDYRDIGVGVSIGEYKGVPNTLFVTQHFATPRNIVVPAVAGIEETNSDIIYDKDRSEVLWQESHDGVMTLTVRAYITGDIASAKVTANQYDINLFPSDKEGIYIGKVNFLGNSDDLFKVVLMPKIEIVDVSGNITNDIIDWKNPKVMTISSLTKYETSKSGLAKVFSIFNVSRGIYLFFIGFFTVALLLKIFVEFRKQHPHVIVQTLVLISLLVVLFEV